MSDIIVFFFLLLSFFLIIFLVRYLPGSNRNPALAILARKVAESHQLRLAHTDHFNQKVLALDKRQQKLLYLDMQNNINRVINLKDIEDCKLIARMLSIQIELICRNEQQEPLSIIFFNQFADRKWRRRKLIKKAIYWESLLKGILHKNQHALA